MRFAIYSHDHEPPHLHGFYAGVQVIVSLLPGGGVDLARRRDAVQPSNASKADVAYVLRLADRHYDAPLFMWNGRHG